MLYLYGILPYQEPVYSGPYGEWMSFFTVMRWGGTRRRDAPGAPRGVRQGVRGKARAREWARCARMCVCVCVCVCAHVRVRVRV